MFVVRQIGLVALAVWLGGMSVIAFLVAPTTFHTFEAADPHNLGFGRVLAGAAFGEVLRRFHLLAYACGGTILLCLLLAKFVGPPPRAFKLRTAIVALMLAIALYSGVPLTNQLASLQFSVAGPINALPETDPRRSRFDRLHATSTALFTVNIALGVVLLAWYARE